MTYVREQVRSRLARQVGRAYRRWLRPTSGRRPGDRFMYPRTPADCGSDPGRQCRVLTLAAGCGSIADTEIELLAQRGPPAAGGAGWSAVPTEGSTLSGCVARADRRGGGARVAVEAASSGHTSSSGHVHYAWSSRMGRQLP
jgi:hypothetical protein